MEERCDTILRTVTELQASLLENKDLLYAINKSCKRHSTKLLQANYVKASMDLYILVDTRAEISNIVKDMTGVLIGIFDINLNQVADGIDDNIGEECCPVVTATDNARLFEEECSTRGGVDLV